MIGTVFLAYAISFAVLTAMWRSAAGHHLWPGTRWCQHVAWGASLRRSKRRAYYFSEMLAQQKARVWITAALSALDLAARLYPAALHNRP